jgi:hypothetical protein
MWIIIQDMDIVQTLLETLFICLVDNMYNIDNILIESMRKMNFISMISTIKLFKEFGLWVRFQVKDLIMEVQLSNRISTYSVGTQSLLQRTRHFILWTQIRKNGQLFQTRVILFQNQESKWVCSALKRNYMSLVA